MEKIYPLEYVGGRKFIGFVLLTLCGTFLVMAGHLDGMVFWGFATGGWSIFSAANVIEKIKAPAEEVTQAAQDASK